MNTLAIVQLILALCHTDRDCIELAINREPATPRETLRLIHKYEGCIGHEDGSYDACVKRLSRKKKQ